VTFWKYVVFVAAGLLPFATGLAYADSESPQPITSEDAAFAVATIVALRVGNDCPQYKVLVDGIGRFSDEMGIQPRVGRAVAQVMSLAAGNAHYDRSQLIPEITRLMNDNNEMLLKEKATSKAKYCNKWGNFLLERRMAMLKGEKLQRVIKDSKFPPPFPI
jgi:hypothetical protein